MPFITKFSNLMVIIILILGLSSCIKQDGKSIDPSESEKEETPLFAVERLEPGIRPSEPIKPIKQQPNYPEIPSEAYEGELCLNCNPIQERMRIEEYNLKGPVMEVKEENYYIKIENGEEVRYSKIGLLIYQRVFNREGYLIESWSYSDGMRHAYQYEYNDSMIVIKRNHLNEEGEILGQTERDVIRRGRVIEITDTLNTREIHIFGNNDQVERIYRFKGKDIFDSYFEYYYDEKGNLIEKKEYSEIPRIIPYGLFNARKYVYDDNGRTVVEILLGGDYIEYQRTEYTYIDSTEFIESYKEYKNGNIITHAYYEYKFDEQGNWTERKRYEKSGEIFSPAYISIREIMYY